MSARELPIIFSAPMVRAILSGHKRQTRRVMKPQPSLTPEMDREAGAVEFYQGDECVDAILCPYGRPGDRLWVRESFSGPHEWATIPPSGWGWDHSDVPIWYWADGNPDHGDWTRPRPSIHMPHWASRITLEVTDVRVQRVQEISEDDARAEGCAPFVEADGSVTCGRRKTVFRELWESINAKRGHSWDANPFVWAITFRRVEGVE